MHCAGSQRLNVSAWRRVHWVTPRAERTNGLIEPCWNHEVIQRVRPKTCRSKCHSTKGASGAETGRGTVRVCVCKAFGSQAPARGRCHGGADTTPGRCGGGRVAAGSQDMDMGGSALARWTLDGGRQRRGRGGGAFATARAGPGSSRWTTFSVGGIDSACRAQPHCHPHGQSGPGSAHRTQTPRTLLGNKEARAGCVQR